MVRARENVLFYFTNDPSHPSHGNPRDPKVRLLCPKLPPIMEKGLRSAPPDRALPSVTGFHPAVRPCDLQPDPIAAAGSGRVLVLI